MKCGDVLVVAVVVVKGCSYGDGWLWLAVAICGHGVGRF